MPPIVPGAFGYGMETRAAFGHPTANPAILRVTTLADRGPGSLRAACEATGPRFVIFEVSGYIGITDTIDITSPYLTVAGQTAPSPGITIRSLNQGTFDADPNYGGVYLNTHDILIQHLSFRLGHTCNSAINFWPDGFYNCVIANCSVSWSQDEGIVIANHGAMTIWRCVIAENFYLLPGSDYCPGGGLNPGHGVAFGQLAGPVALIQNVLAHNYTRNPLINGDTQAYVANNVLYDYHEALTCEMVGRGPYSLSIIGNYNKRGPWRAATAPYRFEDYFIIICEQSGPETGQQMYLSDNVFDNGGLQPPINEFYMQADVATDPRVTSPPIAAPTGYVPMPASAVPATILPLVGSRPWDRDAVDTRIITQVLNRTGGSVHQLSDVGGYPSLAKHTRALTTPANPYQYNGAYTNLERWSHAFVEGDEPPISVGPPGGGGATVTHVATVTSQDNGGDALVHSASHTFQAGSVAVCCVAQYDGLEPTVTSGTLEGALHASPFGIVATQVISGVRVTVLCCPTIAAGPQACHLTFSGPVGFTTTFLTELRGVAVAAPVVGGSVGATGTTAAASTGVLVGAPDSFYLTFISSITSAAPATYIPGPGWTIPTNGSQVSGGQTAALAYRAAPGTTTQNGQFTVQPEAWASVLVELLAGEATP